MKRFKEIISLIYFPLILLLLFILFIIFYQVLNLPDQEEILALAKTYFGLYGPVVIFLAALIEGFLVINWYLPGSAVILLGVSFSYGNLKEASLLVILITIAFIFDYALNYFLGKFGWYRLLLNLGLSKPLNETKKKMEKYGLPIVFSTYFHPNLGALTATSAGILKIDFKRFMKYSILSLILWNIFWGFVAYFFGSVIASLAWLWIIVIILLFWIIFILSKDSLIKKDD